MVSIALQHVGMRYPNGHQAIAGLSLEIAAGELLVLLGPSGSGKTTVLRLIAGLEQASDGRVLLDGRDVTAVPPQSRDLAMVFQSYALYPHMTVRENLAFGLRVRGTGAAAIEARVRETAAALGLETLLSRKPAQLSGGQRQRVALGRAIVRQPKAFLLDEPLSNLDPVLRVETRTEIARLHRRLGATMVYVTHDQEEAMTLGTRIAVMQQGRIEQIAAPAELYRHPANTFVARFVGSPSMNLWPCAAASAGGRTLLRCAVVDLDPGAEGSRLPPQVVLGVRPHDVEIVNPGDADAAGRVDLVEPLGAEALVHVRIADTPDGLVRAAAPLDAAMVLGPDAGIRLRRDRLHLFDRETGERLAPLAAPVVIPRGTRGR